MCECKSCKKADAENTYRFAVVNKSSTSSTKNYVVAKRTTTTVYEKFVTFEKSSICNSCIKKERVKYVLKWTALIAFGILAALTVAAIRTRSFGLWIPIVFGIVTLIGAIGLSVYSIFRKDAFFAADIRTARNSNNSVKYLFVPMDSSLYCAKGTTKPDLKLFKDRGGLRTSVADQLFEKFLLPDNSDELIDSFLAAATEQ
ncbi:MAG: hypothetical protein K6G47_02185 [Clostridia bacterium]|nr:hypothetical protein [Clostridia bacterium]